MAKVSMLEQIHGLRLRRRTKFRFDRFILKKTKVCHFWTSAFCGVTSWQQSEKVEHGCTTTNLALSNSIKIVCVLQRLRDEIGRTIFDVQKRDGKTDSQTKLNVFGHPGGG